jgi:malonyl CoA-acyl carrier protein transacylase
MPETTALLFPGQGSHYEGMDGPHRGHPAFELGLELLGEDPFERLGEGTRFQQPAILLCSIAAWEQRRDDLAPVAAAGHSLGEYAALVAAGALDLPAAVALVAERAAAMADAAAMHPGGMTAMLGGDDGRVRALAAECGLAVANDNAPGQLVLAGPLAGLEQAEDRARDQAGARPRRLDVAGAFHSHLMEPAARRLTAALADTRFAEPVFPVFSCATAAPFGDVRSDLAQNLLSPVRWRQTLVALRDAGAQRFEELGPGEVLTGTVRRTLVAA